MQRINKFYLLGLMALISLSLNAQTKQPKVTIDKNGNSLTYFKYYVRGLNGKGAMFIQGNDTVVIDSAETIKVLLKSVMDGYKRDSLNRELLSLPSVFSFKSPKDKKRFEATRKKLF